MSVYSNKSDVIPFVERLIFFTTAELAGIDD